MKHKFRDHQRAAFQYALRVSHPALFLQMRLGKTLVAIRRCKMLKPMQAEIGVRVLVVAPNSALGSWARELDGEGEDVTWLIGTKKKRREALLLLTPGWHLINKEGWLALPEIAHYPWDAVVLDESTFIKNPRAKVTKFFCKHFRDVTMRMILTGTPSPESAADYFCQFQFLYGRAFGCSNYWEFRQQYMKPGFGGFGWQMKPGASDEVRRAVGRRACIIQRSDVGYDEQRVYERRSYVMPPKLRKAYDTLEKQFEIEWEKEVTTTKWVGGKWQWLRQMCGGFVKGDFVWPAKLDDMINLFQGELTDEKVVVWCTYNNEVSAICDALLRKKIPCALMTGDTPVKERHRLEQEFSKWDGQYVMVVQQAIAQTGADFSAADTAIYYSTPVGGFARQQTEDRILSLEKIDSGVPMLFIDLICEGTVDEDVMTLLADKKQRSEVGYRRALDRAMKERILWTKKL